MRGRKHTEAPSLDGLTEIVWLLAAGLILGFVAANALHWRGLRWTWSLLGALPSYVLWVLDWRFGLAAAMATFTALYVGANDHTEAIRHGGEEARTRREATGPMTLLRSTVLQRRAEAKRVRAGTLALGMTRTGAVCRIPIGEETGVHGLIVGATGEGKTVTTAAIAHAYISTGKPVIVIDPKGDRDLLRALQHAAAQTGARVRGWTPAGPATYNPLGRGGPTEVADKALAAHQWSEPHYELATQRLLLNSLTAMKAAKEWPPTLRSLVENMDLSRLEARAEHLGPQGEQILAYVDSLSARGAADLGGGRDRLAVLTESELGPWLEPTRGRLAIDLAESLRQSEVLYFYLDADRYPVAARLLASALLGDLVGLMSEQGSYSGLVALDEFAALAAPQVSRLFARARSAGLSMLLGTQSLADLRAVDVGEGSDTLTEQVFSNVRFTVAHRVADPDSAERLARLAGTTPSWTLTQRVSSTESLFAAREGTRTREREFVIGPDQFKRLSVGEAIVIDPKAQPTAEAVRIWPAGRGA
jgi:conjugal transfer pilus assembly protein TraD